MRKAVVVLAPDRGRNQQIQRGDVFPPWQVVADRKPLGMLVEHGIDHVHERFVRGDETMPAGKQIAFQHAFTVCSLRSSITRPSRANSPPSISSGKYSSIQNFLLAS